MLSKVFSKWPNLLGNKVKVVALGSILLTSSFIPIYGQTVKTEEQNKEQNVAIHVDDSSIPTTTEPTRSRTSEKKSFEKYILDKLTEAQKILAKECDIDNDTVGISLLERQSGEIYFAKMLKTNFITRDYQENFTLSNDSEVTVHIDQPNFINTKVSVESKDGEYIPLMVKYPIIRGGAFKEMGYYTPAHRVLQKYGFAKLGNDYIDKVLNAANKNLKCKNLDVPDKVFNLAKSLCIVEHIDHGRFRTEDKDALFNEVRTLYALNKANTYRYAVSSAGAGGMVQMIPRTYKEIQNTFPQVDWIKNFESAMMTHENAAKAMLLYLNRYYDFFSSNSAVNEALENKYATEEEIMAAGYNSNPVKVPQALSKGEYWKRSLPQETQIYLAILGSVDNTVATALPENYQPPDRVTRVAYHPRHNRYSREQIRNVRMRSHYRASYRYSGRSHNRYGGSYGHKAYRGRHHRR